MRIIVKQPEFGAAVLQARKDKGKLSPEGKLIQEEAARQIGLSHTVYGQIERGLEEPSKRALKLIFDFYPNLKREYVPEEMWEVL